MAFENRAREAIGFFAVMSLTWLRCFLWNVSDSDKDWLGYSIVPQLETEGDNETEEAPVSRVLLLSAHLPPTS